MTRFLRARYWLTGLALFVAITATAAPAQAALRPVEDFFRQPQVLDAALSPSGRQLAVTTARGTDRVGLVVFDLETGKPPLRAAQFADVDIVAFQWVNDRRLIFSVVDLAAGSGLDRRETPGLFAVDADGSELRQLVMRRAERRLQAPSGGRARALPWHHRLLGVPTLAGEAQPDEVIVGEYFGDGLRNLDRVVPKWLNVRSGLTRHLETDAPAHAVGWIFDRAGRPRVAITRFADRDAIHWRGPGQAEWQRLAESGLDELPYEPRFVDDAGGLYVTHRVGPEGLAVLARYDFDRRAPASEPWIQVDGFDFRGALLGDKVGGTPLGVRVESDAETTVWFDDKLQKLQQQADARFPGRINRIGCRRCGSDDMVALVNSWSDRDPGKLWLYRQATGQWQAIASVMPGIEPAEMATVEFHRIRARDGRDLPVWLTLPAGHRAGAPRPAVVMVHGGPWVRGGHWRWQPMEQFLASRGYLVISPDFRGSTGYGEAHHKAGWKQWGRAMQDDLADALAWARAQGHADTRACIAGASYGGYATLMGLVRHPDLYRCGVAWVAVTDLLLLLEGSIWIEDDTSDLARRYTLRERVGDARVEAEALVTVSPVAQAARIRAPLLLAFGESDVRVPLAHGTRLREALREAGHDPEWVSYPGEGHGWRMPQTQIDFARRVETFLARQLGDAPR